MMKLERATGKEKEGEQRGKFEGSIGILRVPLVNGYDPFGILLGNIRSGFETAFHAIE